ncbi:MAG: DMT family transporter [Acinetobacter sp.]
MTLIFIAALCSVTVSVLIKFAKTKGFNALQMIVWNYLSASILCFLWFKPDFSHFEIMTAPWWFILLLGIILPSLFWCLAQSLHHAGIVKTEVAQRLSVVLSLLAAYFLFQEQFNTLKILGILLGIVSVLCLLWKRKTNDIKQQSYATLFLLCVWIGYALVDVLLKYNSSLGLKFALSLNLVFITAFVLSVLYVSLSRDHTWQLKNIPVGLGLGILNFMNIASYVQAHQTLKNSPAVVFMTMNLCVVLLGILVGIIIFKERIKSSTWLGVIFAVIGILCLAIAM